MVYKQLTISDFVKEFKEDIQFSELLSRAALISIYEYLEEEYKKMPFDAKIITKSFIEYTDLKELLTYNPEFFEKGGEYIRTYSGTVVEIKI